MYFDKEGKNPSPAPTNGLGDRDLLVLLLHEYSDKLIDMSRSLLRNQSIVVRERIDMSFYFLYILISCSFAALVFGAFPSLDDRLLNQFPTINIGAIRFLTMVIAFIFVSFKLFSIVAKSSEYRERQIDSNLLERNARLIANQLESAMRLAVGISDQAEVNVIKRLEWDLRLTYAFRALEYYYSVTEPESKSKPQKSKSNSFKSKNNGIDPLDKGIFIPNKSETK
jgi:hypothetical protein